LALLARSDRCAEWLLAMPISAIGGSQPFEFLTLDAMLKKRDGAAARSA
jgi:hypothetical protein